MTLQNYATLDQLKAQVIPGGPASASTAFSTAETANLELALSAASRWVDEVTERCFFETEGVRLFAPTDSRMVYIDDLLELTELATVIPGDDVEVWDATDYNLDPINARTMPQPRPYQAIAATFWGTRFFPVRPRHPRSTVYEPTVRVTGVWGFCEDDAIPYQVTSATLLVAHRLWRRKDAIFGVAGTAQLGVQVVQAKIQQDSDVISLLSPFMKMFP